MKLFTYYAPSPDRDPAIEHRLMLEWRRRWLAAGITNPRVLCEAHAMRHELYNALSGALVFRGASDNDRALAMRWLAFSVAVGAIQRAFLGHCDVMPDPATEFDWKPASGVTSYHKDHVFLSGSGSGFDVVAKALIAGEPFQPKDGGTYAVTDWDQPMSPGAPSYWGGHWEGVINTTVKWPDPIQPPRPMSSMLFK